MPNRRRLPLYGLDIETDTTQDGLDPEVASVVAVAVSSEGAGDLVFTGRERGILTMLDAHLRAAEPGVIVTWNGGAFDLPFLANRAGALGIGLGLELAWDPTGYRRGRRPLRGSLGTCSAGWYGHVHLDAYRAWRALVPPDEPCGLKSVAKSSGLEPVETDVTELHDLPLADLRRYVASDASLARRLAQTRWPELRRFVDRMPAGGQLAFA